MVLVMNFVVGMDYWDLASILHFLLDHVKHHCVSDGDLLWDQQVGHITGVHHPWPIHRIITV